MYFRRYKLLLSHFRAIHFYILFIETNRWLMDMRSKFIYFIREIPCKIAYSWKIRGLIQEALTEKAEVGQTSIGWKPPVFEYHETIFSNIKYYSWSRRNIFFAHRK